MVKVTKFKTDEELELYYLRKAKPWQDPTETEDFHMDHSKLEDLGQILYSEHDLPKWRFGRVDGRDIFLLDDANPDNIKVVDPEGNDYTPRDIFSFWDNPERRGPLRTGDEEQIRYKRALEFLESAMFYHGFYSDYLEMAEKDYTLIDYPD